uniref:Uncharacterized protein n=1 Tax=Anguilla anguilla TaxID=7936 RepID=A0A0E9PVF5_ANGAN
MPVLIEVLKWISLPRMTTLSYSCSVLKRGGVVEWLET